MNTDLPPRLFAVAIVIVMGVAWSAVPSISHPLGSDWGHYLPAANI